MQLMAQLFYVNHQTETFLVNAESHTAASAAMKKVAASRGVQLDAGRPGTFGTGVAVALFPHTPQALRKFQLVNVTVKRPDPWEIPVADIIAESRKVLAAKNH